MSTWLCVQGNPLQFISNQSNWLNVDTSAINCFLLLLACVCTHCKWACMWMCRHSTLFCVGFVSRTSDVNSTFEDSVSYLFNVRIQLKFVRPSFCNLHYLRPLLNMQINDEPHTHALISKQLRKSTLTEADEFILCLPSWNAEGEHSSFSKVLNWQNHNEIQWVWVCLSHRSPIGRLVCVYNLVGSHLILQNAVLVGPC